MERDEKRRVVREDVRLISVTERDRAFDAAKEMVADGFTAWVFETAMEAGRKTYSLLGVMPSSTSTPSE